MIDLMPQFLYDKNGRPIEALPEKPVFEPAGELNAKCPTCGNRYTKDMPFRNTSGRSVVTTKKIHCDDCDTIFEIERGTPVVDKMKKPPILGEINKKRK